VHALPSSQLLGVPGAQTPLLHASPTVHWLPSSQVEPSGLLGAEHAPLLGSHVPAVWHWSAAGQTTGVPLH
jgi:hypothetical protein